MLHNFYTLKGKSGGATAFNSVNAANYRAAVLGVSHWAKTLTLTDSEGQKAVTATSTEYVNSDPSRGGKLRAMYRGSVMSVAGRKYVRVSLCSDLAGSVEVSGASVTLDGDGDLIEITAVVYLEVDQSEYVCFCGGDNPFVRRLLGCGGGGILRVGWGDCEYPSRPCQRTTDRMTGFITAQIAVTSDGMELSTHKAAAGSEVVVFDGQTPVLRGLRTPSYSIRTTSVTVDGHNAALYSQNIPVNLSSVRLGTTSMLKLDTRKVYDKFYRVRENDGWNIGESGFLAADPSGKYLAVVTEAYVNMYEVDSLDLKPMGRFDYYPGATVTVMRDGSATMVAAQSFATFVPRGDGTFEDNYYAIQCSKGSAVALEGDCYHVVGLELYYYYDFKISSTVYEYTRGKITSSNTFVSRCGDYIAYGDANNFKVCSFDTDYSSEFIAEPIQARTTARKIRGCGEYCIMFSEGTNYFVYDFVHGTFTALVGEGHIDSNLVYDSKYIYLYDHYNGLRRMEGDYDLTGVTGVTQAGDGLFMVRGGRFETYYCHGSALSLRVPRGHEGEKLFANVREKTYANSGKPVKFTLGIG